MNTIIEKFKKELQAQIVDMKDSIQRESREINQLNVSIEKYREEIEATEDAVRKLVETNWEGIGAFDLKVEPGGRKTSQP